MSEITSCGVPNFNKNKHKKLLESDVDEIIQDSNIEKLNFENVDILAKQIVDGLKGESTFNLSDPSVPSYNESIDRLADTVTEYITSKYEKFDVALVKIIGDNIREEFLPHKKTTLEKDFSAIIPDFNSDSDLVTEKDRRRVILQDLLSDIYGTANVTLDNLRANQFKVDITKSTIVDTEIGKMTISDYELNEGIISYLNRQYQIIRDFAVSLYKAKNKRSRVSITRKMYERNDKTGAYELNSNYTDALQIFYNYINNLKREGTLNDVMINSWIGKINGKIEDAKFYNVLCAYINLEYFDENLRVNANDAIIVDDNVIDPIEYDEGANQHTFKYHLKKGNSHTRKNWGVEVQDATEESSDFLKTITASISAKNYQRPNAESISQLSYPELIGSWCKLIDLTGSLSAHQDLFDALQELQSTNKRTDNGPLLTIYDQLFNASNSSSIRDTLKELDFNYNDLNVIYSFFQEVFIKENSWANLENKLLNEKGYMSRYNLVESILNAIKSTAALNYLETTYDYDTGRYITKDKAKFSIDGAKFDILQNVNESVVDRTDYENTVEKYGLTDDSKQLDLDGLDFGEGHLKFNINTGKTDLLDKNSLPEIKLSSGKTLLGHFGGNNLLNNLIKLEFRSKIISGEGLSQKETEFRKVLDFIDTMLSTSFVKDSNQLLHFFTCYKYNEKFFDQIFASAIRALKIQQLYKEFQEQTDENGNSLPLSQFSTSEVLKGYKDKNGMDLDTSDIRDRKPLGKYYKRRYDGYQLTVVAGDEKWISTLATVQNIYEGNTNKSTTSNLEGSKIPNYSPVYLGNDVQQQIVKSRDAIGSASSKLLFVKKNGLLKKVTINSDMKSDKYKTRSIKEMSTVELIKDSILGKFVAPLQNSKSIIYTQAATISDKSKFITGEIDLKELKSGDSSRDKSIMDILYSQKSGFFIDKVVSLTYDSIGEAYKESFKRVQDDFRTLFGDESLTTKQINDRLKGMSEETLMTLVKEYNLKNPRNILNIYLDQHYRITSKGLALNEVLYDYATNQYGSKEALKRKLETDKITFLEELLQCRFRMYNDTNASDNSSVEWLVGKLFNTGSKQAKSWFINNRMILAKDLTTGENITYGKIDKSHKFQLNPILEAYFYLDNLLSNNLRLTYVGTEAVHPVKSLKKVNVYDSLNNEGKAFIDFIDVNAKENLTLYDLDQMLQKFAADPANDAVNDPGFANAAEVYSQFIHDSVNGTQVTQTKRNVPISATMVKIQPSIIGAPPKVNIAVVQDTQAHVFNFSGDRSDIDAHDGSAHESPIFSILENRSLNDSESGNVKKNLLHFYDPNTMSSTLLKYAAFAMTNQLMRSSAGNPDEAIRMHKTFYKMHNMRWHNTDEKGCIVDENDWSDSEIDLSKCDYMSGEINFFEHILEKNNLYYRDGNDHYKIQDLKFDIINGHKVYYTLETKVDAYGHVDKTNSDLYGRPVINTKIYHLFNNRGEHITIAEDTDQVAEKLNNYHTIDSLYELHTALGSIYSETMNSSKYLQYSEASNFAVANYCNFVANSKTKDADGNITYSDDVTIDNYDQPLKRMMIHVEGNITGLKEGSANKNKESVRHDDSDYNYMQVDTRSYGKQLDSDHNADEAQMTEFSQVLSALNVGGALHEYVSEVYELLGKTALEIAKVEMDALKDFQTTGNKSKLYVVIAKTVINNFKRSKANAGLANAIIDNVSKELNMHVDQAKAAFKMPFSDPNVYNTILTTFVSNLNKKAIKRKYPGLGTVMCPGYNIATIYDLNGKKYQFQDIIKMASAEGIKSTLTDVSARQRDIVSQFLWKRQKTMPVITDFESLEPTDNIVVRFDANYFNIKALDSRLVEWEIKKEPWKTNPSKFKTELNIYLKGRRDLGFFQLVNNQEDGEYSIHFKTHSRNSAGQEFGMKDSNGKFKFGLTTPEQRNILFQQLWNAIPNGADVSTYGDLSVGGVRGLAKLMTVIGQSTQVREREVNIIDPQTGNLGKGIIPIYHKPESIDEKGDPINFRKQTLHLTLDDELDYYAFTENPVEFLRKRGYENINPSTIQVQKDITRPRNLAPTKLSVVVNGQKRSVFQHWRLKGLIKEIQRINSDKSLDKAGKKTAISAARRQFNVQKVFEDFKNNIWETEDGQELTIESKSNTPPEVIMSNIYKSKFGIKDGDTLADVLKRGKDYFKSKPEKISSKTYDVVFTKGDGRHIYVSFTNLKQNEEIQAIIPPESNIIRKAYKRPDNVLDDHGIVNRLYMIDNDNVEMFEVGREIVANGVSWSEEKQAFINSEGDVLEDQKRYRIDDEDNSRVLEQIMFVTRQKVTEKIKGKKFKYTLYNIDKFALDRCFDSTSGDRDTELNRYLGRILSDIYASDSYNGIQFGSRPQIKTTKPLLLSSLEAIANNVQNTDLAYYLRQVHNMYKESNAPDSRKINRALLAYHDHLASKIYVSFLKSQYFTASRIPAQTLQSFMQMENVGWTGEDTGQCYVSHWQTWLQGSDYKQYCSH